MTLLDYLDAPPVAANRCHYCHGEFWVDFITKDHIVPRSRGGRNVAWNYVPACMPCNHAKGADMPTCECRTCQTAVHRSGPLLYGTKSGVGMACTDCGCITMTPTECPWCFNTSKAGA